MTLPREMLGSFQFPKLPNQPTLSSLANLKPYIYNPENRISSDPFSHFSVLPEYTNILVFLPLFCYVLLFQDLVLSVTISLSYIFSLLPLYFGIFFQIFSMVLFKNKIKQNQTFPTCPLLSSLFSLFPTPFSLFLNRVCLQHSDNSADMKVISGLYTDTYNSYYR